MDATFNTFLEIIKYILPSIVVAIIAYQLMAKLMEDSQKRLELEIRKSTNHLITPIKLQAYERLILLMERISPPKLIQEYNAANSSALELKNTMIIAIQTEFAHNISQQIYVSNQAWTLAKLVKEEVIDLVSSTFNAVPKDASSIDLSKALVERMIADNKQPTQKAIDFLKAEIRLYF